MRLSRLELLAYGHFRGLALDFSSPGLHVVLGRNEAGKSTTLRAITGLLYGIDRNTGDAHVHKPTDLRIGGTLERGGERLRIVRRKGNTNTLLDPQEKPIDETVLRRMLGGVTQETFVHAYGLDHVTLAKGAEALLEGKGDLGESLFDAGVGGGGEVQRLLADLAREADAIYRPRATSLPLNDALGAFQRASKDVRERQTLPEAFKTQQEGLASEAQQRDDELARKKELEVRRALIVRARQRGPRERQRRHLAEEQSKLGAVPMHLARIDALKDRFGGYERDVEQLRGHRDEEARLGDRLAEAMRRAGVAGAAPELESFRIDARKEGKVNAFLQERAKLRERIDATTSEIDRAERALAKLQANSPASTDPGTRDALATALDRARKLGDIEDRIVAEQLKLDRQERTLASKATALAGRVVWTRSKARAKSDDADAERGDDARDAEAAAAGRKGAGRKGAKGDEAGAGRAKSETEATARSARAEATARSVGVGAELAAFVALALPAVEALDALAAKGDELARKRGRVEERGEELARDGAALEMQIASLAGDFAPPDAAALREARVARDAAWLAVRDADAKKRAGAEVKLEGLLRDADAVADLMIREADRVTTLARLRAEAEANRAQLEKSRTEQTKLGAAASKLDAELGALFAPARIEASSADDIAELRTWLERHEQLVEEHARLAEARASNDAEADKAARAAADLAGVLTPKAKKGGRSATARDAEVQLSWLDAAPGTARSRDQDDASARRSAASTVARGGRSAAAADGDAPARSRDASATPSGGDAPARDGRDASGGDAPARGGRDASGGDAPARGGRDASGGDAPARGGRDASGGDALARGEAHLAELIASATARLAALDEARRAAAAIADQERTRDERVELRKRCSEQLREISVQLATLLGPLGLGADAAADEVNRAIEALRDVFALADKRADSEGRARAAASATAAFEAELARCIEDVAADLVAGDPRTSGRVLFDRARLAGEQATQLTNLDAQLAQLGDAVPADALEGIADLEAAEQELTEQIDDLDCDLARRTELIGALKRGLETFRASADAADAATSAQEHLARVRDGAERWARARLAQVILSREIERYREENQGPLLASSSSLFARLTKQRYHGIKAGFDDKDRPCLRCVREDNSEIDVTALSDGTRDSLYLSLRLASLLRRAEVAEPMPLILDDVLIQLDDDRAAAALEVLAEVSGTMQILFFTHHARLVDLARASVASSELVIHELSATPNVSGLAAVLG